ncbi:MAG: menaquinone biosynthesis protein [Verrucomicrobiota bacterium]
MVEVEHLRVGCVKYLNAQPLIHGWPDEVVFDHPSALCRQLAAGALDVALVSSFEFLRHPIYQVVDDVSISSDGAVHSVFLAHTGELAEIGEIEIDPASGTSVNLLRCLLAERDLAPEFIDQSDSAVSTTRAKLLIGDQAIRFRQQYADDYRFWDLGLQWQQATQLPFVYALWLIRPEVAASEEIAERLRACRDENLRALDRVIAAQTDFPPEFCRFYWHDCLRYHFGAREKKGLSTFRELCEKHAILPAPEGL